MKLVFLFAALWAVSERVHAAVDVPYGLGGESSGRVNSILADTEHAFAAAYNPALIATHPQTKLSLGVFSGSFSYGKFDSVLVDSASYRTMSGRETREAYQVPQHNVTLWSLGASFPFSLRPLLGRRGGIGVSLSGPFETLRSYSLASPYDFTPVRYGPMDNQFRAVLSGSIEVIPDSLYFGAGMKLHIATAGSSEAQVAAENPTGRMALEVGAYTSAVFGLFARLTEFDVGFVYHQEVKPRFVQHVSARARALGTETFDVPLTLTSTLNYEPHTFELDLQRDFKFAIVSAGAEYQLWSRLEPNHLVVETRDNQGAKRQTLTYEQKVRNTLNPRASVSVPFFQKQLWVSGGYQFRASLVEDTSGPTNLLDANTHVLALSTRHQIEEGALFGFPFWWGFSLQHHFQNENEVTKADARSIGAPGYKVSGSGWFYGLFLQAEL